MKDDVRIDVRPVPMRERHPRIITAFEALDPDQTLVLLSDHEPRPLHAQFRDLYGDGYTWEQREFGDGRWEVRLRKSVRAVAPGIAGLLGGASLFEGIGDEALSELAHRARRATVRRHRNVVDAGVLWPYCGFVESGMIAAVLATSEGRDRSLYDILPGDFFGEIALMDAGVEALRYTAMTPDATLVLLPSDAVRGLADRDRAFARRLETLLAQRFRVLLDRMGSSLALSATSRVAKALLPYAAPDDRLTDALAPLSALTHAEIALSAGTVKEVVSRALGRLEEAGALVRHGGHIVKLDRSKLVAAAEWTDVADRR